MERCNQCGYDLSKPLPAGRKDPCADKHAHGGPVSEEDMQTVKAIAGDLSGDLSDRLNKRGVKSEDHKRIGVAVLRSLLAAVGVALFLVCLASYPGCGTTSGAKVTQDVAVSVVDFAKCDADGGALTAYLAGNLDSSDRLALGGGIVRDVACALNAIAREVSTAPASLATVNASGQPSPAAIAPNVAPPRQIPTDRARAALQHLNAICNNVNVDCEHRPTS